MSQEAVEILRDLFETFPQLDPESEYYDDPIKGAELVQWLSENAHDIRKILDDSLKK